MQKNFEFRSGLLCYAFHEAETKEAFCFLLFLRTMTSKNMHMLTKSRATLLVLGLFALKNTETAFTRRKSRQNYSENHGAVDIANIYMKTPSKTKVLNS